MFHSRVDTVYVVAALETLYIPHLVQPFVELCMPTTVIVLYSKVVTLQI